MKGRRYQTKKLKLSLRELLLFCFSIWPLFWNLWVSFRFTDAIFSSFSTIILMGLAMIALFYVRKVTLPTALFWILFIMVITFSGIRNTSFTALLDIPVIMCGFLICFSQYGSEINKDTVLRCLFACGLFVAITVLLDGATHIVRTSLLPLYTDYAQTIIRRRDGIVTGGIIPHNSAAGCCICSGLGACLVLIRREKKKKLNWFSLVIFITALLFLQKRGFIVDIVISIFAIWICGRQTESAFKINVKRLVRIAVILIAIAVVSLGLYYTIPDIKYAVGRLIERFTDEDVTLSGRTVLYAFAYSLFKNNPLWGIGWGAFRAQTVGIFSSLSTSTYEVHNVYLQLLCETGIVGLILFLLSVGSSLLLGIKRYRAKLKEKNKDKQLYYIQLGLFLQLFFLAYCISGNPLYDYNFLITYFIGILLTITD